MPPEFQQLCEEHAREALKVGLIIAFGIAVFCAEGEGIVMIH
jgi:hypothetical protein